MKKSLIIILVIFISLLGGCQQNDSDILPPDNTKLYRTNLIENPPQVVTDELESGLKFFWELANSDLSSNGYGLIPDRFNTSNNTGGSIASIASVGFGLSTLPISVESGYVSRVDAEERAYYTLKTFSDNLERTHGFWYHFLDMEDGSRAWNSEVSIIDSALFINGALVVGKYFGGRTEELAYKLYESIEWNWYFDSSVNKFYMGYKPETGFEGYWNGYAEHLMLFILAAGSPDHSVHKGAYQLMKYNSTLIYETADYGSFYPTFTGSIFTHQYSHAWFDFASYIDQDGFNWFINSVNAVDAAITYAISKSSEFNTLNENSWGMSACDGPGDTILSGDVYRGNYGSGPAEGSNSFIVDGTVPAYGAIGSIVFNPEAAISAMENYNTYEKFQSIYGFVGAYNLDKFDSPWYANDIIGIDKGISVLMLENYLSGMIWKIYMEVPYITEAIDALDFEEIEQ